jgi:hypothetical protein
MAKFWKKNVERKNVILGIKYLTTVICGDFLGVVYL